MPNSLEDLINVTEVIKFQKFSITVVIHIQFQLNMKKLDVLDHIQKWSDS